MGCKQSKSNPFPMGHVESYLAHVHHEVDRSMIHKGALPGPLRLVIVSDELPDYDVLVQSVRADRGVGCVILRYDDKNADNLLKAIEKKVGPPRGQLKSVAHLDHGHAGEFKLFEHVNVDLDALHTHGIAMQFFKKLSAFMAKDAELDLLACCLAEGKAGHQFVEEMRKVTGLHVNASDDRTGSSDPSDPKFACDWVLEDSARKTSSGVDVGERYFDKGKLRLWHHTMIAPAAIAAGVDIGMNVAKVAFDSSIGCCTSPWYRVSCVNSGTAFCGKCQYHYCRYHFPVNNGGVQGGHVC